LPRRKPLPQTTINPTNDFGCEFGKKVESEERFLSPELFLAVFVKVHWKEDVGRCNRAFEPCFALWQITSTSG
jgi:hypothetical protein